MTEVDEDMEDAFAAVDDGEGGAEGDFLSLELDLDYEFDASRYFDFSRPESPLAARAAELWFESAGSYPPSPFIARIDMGANLLGDNVNISPKLKVTVEACHTYSDIGSCEELPMAEETVRGVKDSDMSNNFVKADVKSVKKLPFSNGSTLMKPTASQLAKQNHAMTIRNAGRIIHRLQKPILQNSGKSCKGTLDGVSQASKRQKLEGGRTRKVHDMKQQILLVHKIPQKKEEHNDCNPSLPKPGRNAIMEKNGASTTTAHIFRARPLNRKILEAPTLPLPTKSTPRLPEFQEFHLKTSERAIQHASASSSSQVQNHMASFHSQDADTGNKERQPHFSDLPFAHKLHANDNHPREGKKEVPNFKARPLNKKILSAKGDIGVFRSNKREVTKPLAFNFKTDKRRQQNLPIELFNKSATCARAAAANGPRAPACVARHSRRLAGTTQLRLREALPDCSPLHCTPRLRLPAPVRACLTARSPVQGRPRSHLGPSRRFSLVATGHPAIHARLSPTDRLRLLRLCRPSPVIGPCSPPPAAHAREQARRARPLAPLPRPAAYAREQARRVAHARPGFPAPGRLRLRQAQAARSPPLHVHAIACTRTRQRRPSLHARPPPPAPGHRPRAPAGAASALASSTCAPACCSARAAKAPLLSTCCPACACMHVENVGAIFFFFP
ncbi:hypothetical protein Taro_043966, partial [Colocasia esculenta]|nr:hypothetical protein [Colocasia esculenta]